jgi:hypothetical protein
MPMSQVFNLLYLGFDLNFEFEAKFAYSGIIGRKFLKWEN